MEFSRTDDDGASLSGRLAGNAGRPVARYRVRLVGWRAGFRRIEVLLTAAALTVWASGDIYGDWVQAASVLRVAVVPTTNEGVLTVTAPDRDDTANQGPRPSCVKGRP